MASHKHCYFCQANTGRCYALHTDDAEAERCDKPACSRCAEALLSVVSELQNMGADND